LKVSEIAKIFNGKVINLNEDFEIKGVGSLENAKEGEIAFLSSNKLLEKAKETKASVLLVKEEIDIPKTQIVVNKPDIAFYKLIDILYPDEERKSFISETAKIEKNVKIGEKTSIKDFVVIEEDVEIGDNCIIYPNVYIGKNTKIGNNTILYPNVVIYGNTEIGNNVIIHSGAVIGADGFGYYLEDGVRKKIKHIGKVIIEDDVEIGANTTIDRALVDETRIKKGTKIDNLVMVGHNCEIGDNSVLVSQTGIAGSCKIGKNVIMAGQVGVADHIHITDNVIITAKSGIGKNIEKSGVYGANIPAIEWSKWKRILMKIYSLADKKKK
jgi:UDP-3-O-[3-hydroxymyristoyl] glucosamine N-acyltransferase